MRFFPHSALLGLWLAIFSGRHSSAQTAFVTTGSALAEHHTQVKLFLSADIAKPGDTVWAGVDLKMEPGWHTYWKNPGDAGEATEIKWTLPAGVTAGEIQWPLPEKLPPAEVTTYGYEDEVMLLVPLKIETNFPAGQIDLKANVSWLECNESCIPANQDIQAELNIGSETKISTDAVTIESWQKKVPQHIDFLLADYLPVNPPSQFKDWEIRTKWEKPTNSDTRPLVFELSYRGVLDGLIVNQFDFFPYANDNFEVEAATERFQNNGGLNFYLRKNVKKFNGDWPKIISGVIVDGTNDSSESIEVKLPIADQTASSPAQNSARILPVSNSSNSETSKLPAQSLFQMLLYAFIGGLILNIMPCVLPVIALKILGFVSEARSEPRRVRALGLVYALGVLVSFLTLATIVIGVKAAGHKAGWGMQFGSPIFIVCLVTLVTLVALNLFGVFEVTLGGKTLDAAGNLASRHGASGAFFNGVLATTLATPCTAPFLAPALGFAFAQTAPVILLVFLFVGLGLASPYVLLSWNPAWLKFLPRPGAWMEKFKIAMGFPMLLTAVWLFNLAAENYDNGFLWLGIFLVGVAFAAWVFGEFFQRGRSGRKIVLAVVALVLASDYFFTLEKELNWRTPAAAGMAAELKNSPDSIAWSAWTPDAVTTARAAGHPVLVDFTADWCLTCQINKKTSLEIASVRAKLKELNAVALTGDYTHFPDSITSELNRFQRAGVPLVLVYPKNPEAPPIVLPEVLTPGIVLNALARAAQ